jgi:NADH-quinone oxidoreductase subunit L
MDPVSAAMTPIEVLLKYPGPWLAWILPMIGSLSMPILSRFGHKVRDYGAVAWALTSVISAASMIPWLFTGGYPGDVRLTTWIAFPGAPALEVGVLVDPLSILICNVVAFISFLIVVYSTEYMHGDKGLTRFWFFFLFFIGSMLLLVLSNNLVQTMFGWEGVGLCSYGLIGYYFRDEKERWLGGPPPTPMVPPSHAGMKAFVVTGIGDVFLLAAIFIIYNFAGTLNYVELINTTHEWLPAVAAVPGVLALTAVLFLGGPIGKSAQFPLHEWLPEAMAGPTSVSALIHAATMVKAGVYLVARMSPIFYLGTWELHIPEAQIYFITIACVGAFTCFLAASQAMVAVELKKILAYSTVSQIGYMMLGLGVSGLSEGAYVAGLTAGIFHLTSHALFKAALFLGAGSVIHAVHTIYTFNMGGMRKYMPITFALMTFATASLAGIPPLSGFWSKDAVFLACLKAGTPLSLTLLAVGAISAAMTFFYSIRYIYVTFVAPPSDYIHDMEHHGHNPHEAPKTMWVPIAILAALVGIVGLLGLVGLAVPSLSPEIFIEEQLHHMLDHMHIEVHVPHGEFTTTLSAWGLSAAMLLIGGVLGRTFYLTGKMDSWAFVKSKPLLKSIHTFLWNRWYLNPAYYTIFVYGVIDLAKGPFSTVETKFFGGISDVVARSSLKASAMMFNDFEVRGMDGVINRGVPALFTRIYHTVKKVQTGVLSYNIMYIVLLLVLLLIGLTFLG